MMRHRCLGLPHCLLVAALAALLLGAGAPTERRVWATEVADHADFMRFTSPVNGVPFTKFVVVPDTGVVYLFWTAVYPFHYHFVTQVMLAAEGGDYTDIRDFDHVERGSWERRFHMGAIGWRDDTYAFEFLESDAITPDALREVYGALKKAFKTGSEQLRFRPVAERHRQLLAKVPDVPWIAADFATREGHYQLLSAGKAVGKLRLVGKDAEVERIPFDVGDIVVLEKVPDDIAPISGILCTVFTSPLGHVNLRARAWGIPNAGLKNGLALAKPLEGKTVYYEARADGATLREATPAERTGWAAKRPKKRAVRVPRSDLTFRGLPDLVGLRTADVTRVGAKAANLGELASLGGKGRYEVPGGFALPFVHYVEHINAHGINRRIKSMLASRRFRKSRAHREGTLKELREKILYAPMDGGLKERLVGKVQSAFPGKGVFVRSSTNAEDLPGFNGAGLYDTVPNVKGADRLEQAVKQVWASLWNFRAYEERERAGIDHSSVYPAVLLQVAAPADGSGVMITQNLFDPNAGDAVYINAKRGLGLRVVGGDKVPEQVLYDEVTHELHVISRSDDPIALIIDESGGVREVPAASEPFLNHVRVRALVKAAKRVRELFPDAPQDIEWLITGEKRVWLVQTRPYLEGLR